MRLLGIDFGSVRIGVAVGETEVRIASPRPALDARGSIKADAEQVLQLARREEVERIVVGIPEQDEAESRQARVCRMLIDRLTELGADAVGVDESYTSVESEAALRETDLKASERRKRRDGEAACRILERYFRVLDEA